MIEASKSDLSRPAGSPAVTYCAGWFISPAGWAKGTRPGDTGHRLLIGGSRTTAGPFRQREQLRRERQRLAAQGRSLCLTQGIGCGANGGRRR